MWKAVAVIMVFMGALASCGPKQTSLHDSCVGQGITPGSKYWSACMAAPQPQSKRVNPARKEHQKMCIDYGFKPETDKFAECLMALDLRDEERRRAALEGLFKDLGDAVNNISRPVIQPFPQQTIIVPGVGTCLGHVCY